jgi:hypothetical protein
VKKGRCEAEDSGGSVREVKVEGGGIDELFRRENIFLFYLVLFFLFLIICLVHVVLCLGKYNYFLTNNRNIEKYEFTIWSCSLETPSVV